MKETLTATISIVINAPASKVWEAITNPEMIKQYLFGTNVTADWKVGGTITYSGEWNRTAYEDKGKILNIVPEKLLDTTYWSVMSGLADVPENYNRVTYELSPEGDATKITITQDNIKSEEAKADSEKNWGMVLGKMKELLEK